MRRQQGRNSQVRAVSGGGAVHTTLPRTRNGNSSGAHLNGLIRAFWCNARPTRRMIRNHMCEVLVQELGLCGLVSSGSTWRSNWASGTWTRGYTTTNSWIWRCRQSTVPRVRHRKREDTSHRGSGAQDTQRRRERAAHTHTRDQSRTGATASALPSESSGRLGNSCVELINNLAAEAAQFISDRRVSPTDCATVCTAQTMLNQNMLLHCRQNLN